MKKRGFTLIELLAVIIILAIIAIIAVPQVLKVIERANKGASEASAYGYIDAVEKYMVMHDIDPIKYPAKLEAGKTYKIDSRSEISFINLIEKVRAEEEIYINDIVKIKGDIPYSGYIKVGEKNKVEYAKLKIKAYEVICENDKCEGNKVGDTKSIRITNKKTEFLELEEYNLNVEVEPKGSEITYLSSNESVATIDEQGKIKALAEGQTTITVKSGSKSDSVEITVGKESVKIVSATKSYLALNEEYQLNATTYPSNEAVSWSSSDESVATVSSTGLVKAVGSGSVTITASSNGKTDSVTFQTGVSSIIIKNGETVSVKKGSTLQISAETDPKESGATLAYSSSNTAVATIDADGIVTGEQVGTANITISGGGKSATIPVTVYVESVSISGNSEVTVGSTLQLTGVTSPADGTITWSSSNTSVATVSSTGLVTGVQAGSVTITAASGDKSNTKTITVKQKTYTVRFNANGGTGSMSNQTFTYGTSQALTSNGFSRSGYSFLGWSTSSSATSATYTNGQSVSNLSSTNGAVVDLYAIWKANSNSVISPVMTSMTTPSGKVLAARSIKYSNPYSYPSEAWWAMAGPDKGYSWSTSYGDTASDAWWGYDFGKTVYMSKITARVGCKSEYMQVSSISYILQVSTDGTNFTTISTPTVACGSIMVNNSSYYGQIFELSIDRNCRAVKIIFNSGVVGRDSWPSSHYGGLTNVQIYGQK